MSKQRFNKACRIRHQTDFDRIYQAGHYLADAVLVIYADRNRLTHSRLGLSVSRKVGGAILRNRWKRLTREAFRLSQFDLPLGLDFVVRPRRGAEPDFQSISESLRQLTKQLAEKVELKAKGD